MARTPWPVFTLGMLQADIIGALLVVSFLRFGLPPEDRLQLQDLPVFNLAVFLGFLFVSFTVASYLSLRLLIPVMRWQRRDMLLGDRDPAETELARTRALRMPYYRSLINVMNWFLGSIVFIVASWPVASRSAPVIAVASGLGATATAIIGYLQSERILRPVAVAALRGGVPENFRAPGVILRQVMTWVLSTAVPILAIVLAVVASKFEILTAPASSLTTPILILAITALVVGLAGTVLVAMSIADPLRQLRWALGEVQRGNYNAHMQIYDASELGLLQAGFNDMVRDLAERQRLRDLFGRYVGEDV
ncbi:HAMP domain-containing protein, partial [Mycolicibacterium pulveris]